MEFLSRTRLTGQPNVRPGGHFLTTLVRVTFFYLPSVSPPPSFSSIPSISKRLPLLNAVTRVGHSLDRTD